MTADIAEQTGVRLGPGTSYGALTELADRGLVAALPAEDRSRPYEITNPGREALAAQLRTWSRVVQTGRS